MDNIKYKRIFITGASGTGKTTLARWISINTRLPFLSTSAKEVWPSFGVKTHREVIQRSFTDMGFCMAYQYSVYELRRGLIQKKDAFVTDRSPFDNYAHYMLQGGQMENYNASRIFASQIGKSFEFGDLVIFIRFNPDTVLEDDGKRMQNRDAQYMIDGAIDTVIKHDLLIPKRKVAILELNTWDLDDRKRIVKKHLLKKKSWLSLLL